ncbi:RNA-guided endonuclease InsQ/TnpB family protein, partial [Methanosarcina mazei]
HRPVEGEIKRLNVRKMPTGKWFVSFLVETDTPLELQKTGLSVGVDVGIKSFLTLSDGNYVPNPRFFVTEEKFLAKVQRKLNIKGMIKNHKLAKHIADVAWNKLVTITSYKAEWAGKRVELVNPCNTSQMCSGCGEIVKKELSERIHSCPYCGLTLDRDHNAAINIMRLGLQSLQNSGRCPSLQ